jgi:AcrR family transcriptional regulator
MSRRLAVRKTIRTDVGADSGKDVARESPPAGKRAERMLQILREARVLFAEEGYAGFSVRTLARRMGMSQGHLQYYFARKEQLFEALVRNIIESYEPRRLVADYGDCTPEQRLEGFVQFLIEDLKDPMTNAIFFELWSIGQRDQFGMTMVDQFYQRYVSSFDELIAAINPKLEPTLRRIRAALVATQIEGLMILLARGRPLHRYLMGIERECVIQILRLARQPNDLRDLDPACGNECR